MNMMMNCSMKYEYENELFNEIWIWEWNVQLNMNMRMKCSMKYEYENELFNEIWIWEWNVQ